MIVFTKGGYMSEQIPLSPENFSVDGHARVEIGGDMTDVELDRIQVFVPRTLKRETRAILARHGWTFKDWLIEEMQAFIGKDGSTIANSRPVGYVDLEENDS
jgi:hypothetical protein